MSFKTIKVLLIGILSILCLAFAVLALNAYALLTPPLTTSSNLKFSPNNIRGVAVEIDGLLYTLNFEQQNALIKRLNEEVETPPSPDIKKIIIYQFN